MQIQILDDGSKSAGYVRGYLTRQEEVDVLLARVREIEAGLAEYADHRNWAEVQGHAVFLAWERQQEPERWTRHPWQFADDVILGDVK